MNGKAKEEFEKWLDKKNHFGLRVVSKIKFEGYPHSMKWGVIVDFFDSVDIIIDTEKYSDHFYEHYIKCYGKYVRNKPYKINGDTRQKAREKAIEKSCEIFNKTP